MENRQDAKTDAEREVRAVDEPLLVCGLSLSDAQAVTASAPSHQLSLGWEQTLAVVMQRVVAAGSLTGHMWVSSFCKAGSFTNQTTYDHPGT
jgi:hypothetical protein